MLTLCTSTDGLSCTNTAWNKGHIVFRDGGVAGSVNPGDVVLRVEPAASDSVTLASAIQSSGAAFTPKFVSFDAEGQLVGANALAFTACAPAQMPRLIVIRRNGHISPTKGSIAC